MNPVNIAIYLYDNSEVLDFSGPFEVFSTASRLAAEWNYRINTVAPSTFSLHHARRSWPDNRGINRKMGIEESPGSIGQSAR